MYLEKEKENVPLLEFFEELKQKQKLAQKPDYPNLEIFLQRLSFSSSDFFTPEQMEKMSKETSILKFFLFPSKFFIYFKVFFLLNSILYFSIDSRKFPGVLKKRSFWFGWFSITWS